eukprot:CAMPEP_0118852088 /NCGR_PEP_ID=MMETSP1163-20130328/1256_1 /TAXON_ID=124430 /ORGANISM="Phaeomonas parva, Strain CCMP2877" /LENGTH=119 /DNA_ID=CAMNT_0006784491 /DNA_START=321 /DNA_END=680 /DNA_ORIENTATION=-
MTCSDAEFCRLRLVHQDPHVLNEQVAHVARLVCDVKPEALPDCAVPRRRKLLVQVVLDSLGGALPVPRRKRLADGHLHDLLHLSLHLQLHVRAFYERLLHVLPELRVRVSFTRSHSHLV